MSAFDLDGQVAVVTGGSGALGGAIARGLAAAGATIAVLGRDPERTAAAAEAIASAGGRAAPLLADVGDRAQLEAARDEALERWGRIDVLVNAAGGNVPAATLAPDGDLWTLPTEAFEQVVRLNLTGMFLTTQVFGESMARRDPARGCVVNVSSMTAERAVTRVGGYGAAKAAVDSLTRWLAVELARRHGPGLRVNAIAPGFFIGEQNRRLLLHDDGSLTGRGAAIVAATPAGRFGEADEVAGTVVWLCSDAARFVTGVVVPIDGGFSAFSGI